MTYGIENKGYDFVKIQNIVDSAKFLSAAGDNDGARRILILLADEIKASDAPEV